MYKIKYCANLGAEVFSSETKDKGFQRYGDVKNNGFQHQHCNSFSKRLQEDSKKTRYLISLV